MREVIEYHCNEFSRIFKDYHNKNEIQDVALKFRTSLYFWNSVFNDTQRLVSHSLKTSSDANELRNLTQLQDFFMWFEDLYPSVIDNHHELINDIKYSLEDYVPARALPKIEHTKKFLRELRFKMNSNNIVVRDLLKQMHDKGYPVEPSTILHLKELDEEEKRINSKSSLATDNF